MVKTRESLSVLINGNLVGHLEKMRNSTLRFRYDQSWLDFVGSRPISLSLPLRSNAYEGDLVDNYFRNLLPDNPVVLNRIQTRLNAASTKTFDLLAAVGKDCVGALQFLPEGQNTTLAEASKEPLTEKQIAQLLSDCVNYPLGMDSETDFRISIAGAQEKTALLNLDGQWFLPLGATPTTHILKLPIGKANQIDLSESCENEWICLRLAKAFGLNAVEAKIHFFENQKALVVKRFDRATLDFNHQIVRLPTEDFCQVLGFSADNKYETDGGPGISDIFNILYKGQNALVDCQQFFAMQIFSWLIEAPDAHAKNYSIFLLKGGRYRLTPFYDILSASPLVANHSLQHKEVKLAMGLTGKNKHYRIVEILPRHFISVGEKLGLGRDVVNAQLENFAQKASFAIAEVEKELSTDFPHVVADPIFESILKKTQKIRQGIF